MTTFQRARSEEQREQRREAILAAAAQMLSTMSVAELSLNELSRRVGLAKSNVLRYFESREQILLTLLTQESDALLDGLTVRLDHPPDRRRGVRRRAESVARVITEEVVARPALCELISAQMAVLERNVSARAAMTFKKRSLGHIRQMAALIRRQLPELDEKASERLVFAITLQIGAAWTACRPAPALEEAYRQLPELRGYHLELAEMLYPLTLTLIVGQLALDHAL